MAGKLFPAMDPGALIFQVVPIYRNRAFRHHRLDETGNNITFFIKFNFRDHEVFFLSLRIYCGPLTIE